MGSTNLLTAGAMLITMALLARVEGWIPREPRELRWRAQWGPNLALTFVTFATNAVFNTWLVWLVLWGERGGTGILRGLGLDPAVVDCVAVLLLDFSFYVAHIAMHKIPALWRVHRVHHSDPAVDVTTTIRQHPLEGPTRYAFMAAFALALGVSLRAFLIYRLASALIGLLEHANIRLPAWLDRALAWVTTWPSYHKIHHSRALHETNTNYGNIFSWFDRFFGTFTPPSRGATVLCGLDGSDDPQAQTLTGLLTMPFAPDRRPPALAAQLPGEPS